ncbi:MAG TPA: ATP synthase F1 subunit delta [Thermoanaerobaculales bacterium]|nr:ATP synthase F1 subunit delta [Thermoanaerobaculales bacterium]HPA82208.1 ATP synthase F1 subunit delta [Thermoanaerobaculales bacterium]HQL28841.1 ATP synthase F1 subunit delta [Thermoanaerobaculales bacterium]HQN97616.1 ATP synthase F1 subunit delta [Thermoanaerobaculales bacterium]HQP42267.1 ATP synthase F1 subunit delta [Thermoanaerobaculales bacterium]
MARFRALPYAKALYEVVNGQDPQRVEGPIEELARVAEAIEAVPELLRVLTTPMVSVQTKTDILEAVLDSLAITEPSRRFVQVVQQHYRMEHMRDIATAYRELVDRAQGRQRARIEVAGELPAEQQRQIARALAEVLGIEIAAEFISRPELLAGFRAQVGSKLYDGSLVGQVDRLTRQTITE